MGHRCPPGPLGSEGWVRSRAALGLLRSCAREPDNVDKLAGISGDFERVDLPWLKMVVRHIRATVSLPIPNRSANDRIVECVEVVIRGLFQCDPHHATVPPATTIDGPGPWRSPPPRPHPAR